MNKFFEKNRDLFVIRTEQGKLTLLGLLWPVLLENILRNLLSTVNTVLLSRFSEGAVTAVGISSQILSLVTMFQWVIAAGAAIIISQNLGAGNKRKATNVATVTLFMLATVSIIVSVFMYIFAEPLLTLLNLDSSLMEDGVTYLRITVAFSVFEGLISALSSIQRSYGDTKMSMYVMFIMNVLNAVGSYIVVIRPFETPFVGVAGVAILREASVIIAFAVYVLLLRKSEVKIDIKAFKEKPLEIFWEVLRIGIPSGITFFSYDLSQIISTAIIAGVGVAAVAAKQYVSNIVLYVSLAGSSLGTASGIMIGWLVGAGEFDRAYKVNLVNLRVTMVLNALFSIILYIFRYSVLSIFTPSAEALELAASVLLIDIFVEIGRGMNNVGDNALSSAGDVRFSMFLNIFSCWFFSILFSWIFGVICGWGLYGCWISFAMDELFRGVMNFSRWKSLKWHKTAEQMQKNTAVNY